MVVVVRCSCNIHITYIMTASSPARHACDLIHTACRGHDLTVLASKCLQSLEIVSTALVACNSSLDCNLMKLVEQIRAVGRIKQPFGILKLP